MSQSSVCRALVGVICLLLPRIALSQEPAPPPVVIRTLGGFLGYMDGQRAAPGEMYGWTDQPKGGLLGAADWLVAHRTSGDIFVMTANNLPHDSGGPKLRDAVLSIGRPPASYRASAQPAIRADAIAFGIDDFLRALKQGGQAGTLYDALRDPQAPPFVISNGIVRIFKKRLNTVDASGFHLNLPRDESIDWVRSLNVTCGHCPNVTATLEETLQGRDGNVTMALAISQDKSFRRMTLTVPHGLRPGATYRLTITPYNRRRAAVFSFRTHLPLAPMTATTDSPAPGRFHGLPVRYVTRPAAVISSAGGSAPTADACPANGSTVAAPIVIVGLADPTSDSRSGDEMWNWEGGSCPTGTCVFDFISPLDAIDAIKGWTAPDDPCTPPPSFLLLSGLTEVQMQPVVTQHPEIRWVVIDYDSRVLGQHRGRDAIINPSSGDTTQLWARPQWVGSSATTLTARMTWKRQPAVTGRSSRWYLTDPEVHTDIVEGRKLAWTLQLQTGKPPAITYYPEGDPATTVAGPLSVYPSFPGMLNRKTSQGRLWTDTGDMAAFVLDIMRQRGHADLAVLPAEFVDGDTMEWLASEFQNGAQPLDWLSRFVAARVFYREEQIVTVEVPGNRLVETINGIIATEHGRFGDVYGAGFGTNGWLPIIQSATPELNGRRLNPNYFYRVAMPQSVAEEQLLPARHVVLTSLLDEIDERMIGANGARAATTGSLGEQLEEQFARRGKLYMSATPARIAFTQEVVEEGNAGVFSKIPLEGRSAQSQENWGFAGLAEIGWDYRTFAYRLIGEAAFAKQTISDIVLYPIDEWTAGFRADWKIERHGIRRVFGGLFRQSWFSDHIVDSITPTRIIEGTFDPETGLRLSEVVVSGPVIRPEISRPVYDFFRGGVDLYDSSWKAFTLKGVAVAFDWGQVQRDRDSVRISNGEPISLNVVYERGLTTLLNEAFDRDPIDFLRNPTVEFGYADHDQRRLQLDGGLEFAPWNGRVRWITIARYRRYFNESERVNFTPNQSVLYTSQLFWGVFRRVRVGPFIDAYRVEAKGADGPFIDREIGFALEVPLHVALRPGLWLR